MAKIEKELAEIQQDLRGCCKDIQLAKDGDPNAGDLETLEKEKEAIVKDLKSAAEKSMVLKKAERDVRYERTIAGINERKEERRKRQEKRGL